MNGAADETAAPAALEGRHDAPAQRSCRTSFALVDPGLLRSTLFRPLPRRGCSAAQTAPLEAVTNSSGVQLTVSSPFRLGAEDLSVLLALCALAKLDGEDVRNSGPGVLKERFQSTKIIGAAQYVGFRTTLFGLVRETGLADSGKAYDRVRKALERLGSVFYNEERLSDPKPRARARRVEGSERLLWSDADQKNSEVQIILGARLSNAIGGRYFTWIDLDVARALSEPDLLLHVQLSERIWTNENRSIRLDTLAARIFGSPPTSEDPLSARQRSSRRQYVRRSLESLGTRAGPGERPVWNVDLKRDVAKVSRVESACGPSDNVALTSRSAESPSN